MIWEQNGTSSRNPLQLYLGLIHREVEDDGLFPAELSAPCLYSMKRYNKVRNRTI